MPRSIQPPSRPAHGPRAAGLGALLLAAVASAAAAAVNVTADTPLLDIYVPGQDSYNTPEKKNYALLNPKAPPPAFKEDNAVARQCGSLAYATSLVDRAAVERAQQSGRSIAQARQVWEFEQTRLQAQARIVDGSLARRTVEPVGPRPTGGDAAPRGRSDAVVQPRNGGGPEAAPRSAGLPRITAGGLLGMLGIKQPAAPSPSAQPAPAGRALGTQPSDIRAFMPDFDKMKQQVDHNQAVLAAQDERLKGQEQQYARALTDALAQGLDRLSAAGQPLSLAQLNDFEMFRAYQVEQCIAARSVPDAATRARLDALFDRYQPMAAASIAAARPQVLHDIQAARNPAAFREVWAGHFSTPWLSNAAEKDPELAQPVTQRMSMLLAQEKREREDAERRAAEEVVRQAALVKKRYLDNAARNVAPTEDEVAKLATTYLIENTNAEGQLGRLRRINDRSFDQEIDHFLWGRRRITNTVQLVNDLRCQPKGKVQSCTAKVNTIHYRLQEGQQDRQEFNVTETIEADYQWTADGLESAGLKKGVSALISVRVSGGGGGGGSSSGSDRARDRERDDFYRESARRSAAMNGDSYNGQSNGSLRREFGFSPR
ncbi:hypothetical protein [Roseateles sp.]|uniref:hypothetical protein n=1 Tax=Roseateles sp. TaxID=1971397 RepID=UPI0039E8B55B